MLAFLFGDEGIAPPKAGKLPEIYKEQMDEEILNAIRLEALKARKPNANDVSNSLIGRVKLALRNSKSGADFRIFIDGIYLKKAYETLKKGNIIEELEKLSNIIDDSNFKSKKEYWLTYFKAMRLNNNNKEKKDGNK